MKASDPRYSGTLELTWTNKDQCLLSHEDSTYERVGPSNHRVAETRLLHDAGTVGEVHDEAERAKDNLLIRGEALHALRSLSKLPEFGEEMVGKVKLCYIDPPYNTGQAFEQFDDGLERSTSLTMMRDRLVQIKKLLSPEGSVWVQCDDAEQAYLRVLMDELFGRDAFVATVVWQKVAGRENRTHIGAAHDYILVYAPLGKAWRGVRNLLPYDETQKGRYANPDDDPRGPWASGDFTAQAGRAPASQFYELVTPSGRRLNPPAGRCWLYTEDRFKELVEEGRVWFGADGKNAPRLKRFLSEMDGGVAPNTWWAHPEAGTNDEAKKEILRLFPDGSTFATPKPERLMERIVHIASDPGDLVLDCFAGSGTTAAVAHKMGRRWATVEWSRATLGTFTAPRLQMVASGEDRGGISQALNWFGGRRLPGPRCRRLHVRGVRGRARVG